MAEIQNESTIAQVGIIVVLPNAVNTVNEILHAYAQYIIGRMGLPVRERNICVINLTMDAPLDIINALCGKLGKIEGVKAKALCVKC